LSINDREKTFTPEFAVIDDLEKVPNNLELTLLRQIYFADPYLGQGKGVNGQSGQFLQIIQGQRSQVFLWVFSSEHGA